MLRGFKEMVVAKVAAAGQKGSAGVASLKVKTKDLLRDLAETVSDRLRDEEDTKK